MKSVKIALFIAVPCTFVLLAFMLVGGTKADEKNVTATVTIGNVSVTLAPTSFNYGTMPFNTTKESFDVIDGGSKNISATVGSVVTNLTIKGADSTGGSGWTLAGTNGAGTYVHSFGEAADQTTQPGSYATLNSASFTTLKTGVAASGVVWFGLRIQTPTSGEEAQQSAVVTVLASFGG